jgi:hypothetical protein
MKNVYDFGMKNIKTIAKRNHQINKGFKKIRNCNLKNEFEKCNKVKYNSRKHIKLSQLGFKTIYQLDSLGKRRWSEYFNSGGKVYIISYSTKLPLYKRILFDRKIRKYIGKGVPLPLKPKSKKRGYIFGGRSGKVLGFNFYFLYDKERLMPKHRRILLLKSETYISEIYNKQSKFIAENIDNNIVYLDPSLSDIELVENWNKFFANYGFRFKEFEKQWFKLYTNTKDIFNNISNENISEHRIEFDFKEFFKQKYVNFG